MANGTRNVFITQTKNPFLPYIQAFTDYMGQYMQQQGALAEKMYELRKKKIGENLSAGYMDKIKNAKSVEDVTQSYANAYTELMRAGLPEYAGRVGQFADLRSREIGVREEKDLYKGRFNAFAKAMGENKFKYGDQLVTGSQLQSIISSQTDNPRLQYELFKDAAETGVLKTNIALGYDPSLTQFTATEELIDATNKVFRVPGEEPVEKPIITQGSKSYYDKGPKGLSPEDELVSGDVQEKISALKFTKARQDAIDARIGRSNQLTQEDVDKAVNKMYYQGVSDFVTALGTNKLVSSERPTSSGKKLVVGSKTGLSGFSLSQDTGGFISSLLKQESGAIATPGDKRWDVITNMLFNQVKLENFGEEESSVPLADVNFYIYPQSMEERNNIINQLGKLGANQGINPLYDPRQPNQPLPNPEVIKYFKDINAMDSYYALRKLKDFQWNANSSLSTLKP